MRNAITAEAFLAHQRHTMLAIAKMLEEANIEDVKIIEPSDEVPFFVLMSHYYADENPEPYSLTAIFFPETHLSDDGLLLQLFLQLPSGLMPQDEALIARVLPYLNNALPFGYFSLIPQDDGFWYINFRYVHMVSAKNGLDVSTLRDYFNLMLRLPSIYDMPLRRLIKKEITVTELFKMLENG
ncbi:MAG: hypothetical protein EAZ57_02935 [Cytophagales bacterium]|nr:MAG: hypothetical protein EAZ57_02935 [Cytophagales bacterium]